MRKLLLSACAIALVAGMATSSFASSGTTALNWNITVTFSGFDIDLSATIDPLTFGNVSASQDVFSNFPDGNPRSTIQNDGYAEIDYTALVACATGWSFGATLGSNTVDNTCVLAAVFTAAVIESEESFPDGRDLGIGNFADNDVLGASAVSASISNLAIDVGSGGANGDDALIRKGYDVQSTFSTRSLRYLLQVPLSVSGTGANEQTLVVTIGAVLS